MKHNIVSDYFFFQLLVNILKNVVVVVVAVVVFYLMMLSKHSFSIRIQYGQGMGDKFCLKPFIRERVLLHAITLTHGLGGLTEEVMLRILSSF